MSSESRAFARSLRARQTSVEDLVWRELRGRRLGGLKFKHQQPIGPYVVDFLCFSAKLVVEIDGKQHEADAEYDERRTRDLERQGLSVLRFPNRQVRERLDDLLDAIVAAARLRRE